MSVEPFYALEFFQNIPKGLPEAILKKEESSGKRMPSGDITGSVKHFSFEGVPIWLGRVGSWYFIGMPLEEGQVSYEVFESQMMCKHFFAMRAETLPPTLRAFWLKEVDGLNER